MGTQSCVRLKQSTLLLKPQSMGDEHCSGPQGGWEGTCSPKCSLYSLHLSLNRDALFLKKIYSYDPF